ncbi:MAG: Lrp/AsnC family transcriptional regulator [Verrucomicrobia bacterium]|nr:Lrp/AsnC family transcriptional regulator [Verrucomicrobiota bacterium]
MDPLLKLLRQDARLTPAQLARMLDLSEEEIASRIRAYEQEKVILGYQAVLNEEKLGVDKVRAMIEVKITPEREGGFDRIAARIAKYAEVRSCYLMSGPYDLLVEVEGGDLREVAMFVAEKLATIPGVLSTATHFTLRAYKEGGVLMQPERSEEKLPISP